MTRKTLSKMAAAGGLLALLLALAPGPGLSHAGEAEESETSWAPVAAGTAERSTSSSPGADPAPRSERAVLAFAQLPPVSRSLANPRNAETLLPSRQGLQVVQVTVLLR